MKSIPSLFLWAALAACTLLSSCNGCGDTKKEPPLQQSNIKTGSFPTLVESIPLQISAAEFQTALASLAGIPTADMAQRIPCHSVSEVAVINTGNGEISERVGGNHLLLGCTLLQAGLDKSWEASSVSATFVDDKLQKISYRAASKRLENLRTALTARYGQGESRRLKAINLLGEENVNVTLWQVRNTVIALQQHSNDISITLQGAGPLDRLPGHTPAAEKGTPVSLEDIGISGDYHVPLDDLPIPDSADGDKPSGTI